LNQYNLSQCEAERRCNQFNAFAFQDKVVSHNNKVAFSLFVSNTTNGGGNMSIHATKELQAYWKENLRIITVLLGIWFVVSYVCGILIANQLDAYSIGGFPLGFWFANQGSLVIFVVLIWVYVWQMDNLDKKYDVHEG